MPCPPSRRTPARNSPPGAVCERAWSWISDQECLATTSASSAAALGVLSVLACTSKQYPPAHLELIPQRELHHAVRRRKPRVIAERKRILHRGDASAGCPRLHSREHVKPVQIGNIEYFPAELQALTLLNP